MCRPCNGEGDHKDYGNTYIDDPDHQDLVLWLNGLIHRGSILEF